MQTPIIDYPDDQKYREKLEQLEFIKREMDAL